MNATVSEMKKGAQSRRAVSVLGPMDLSLSALSTDFSAQLGLTPTRLLNWEVLSDRAGITAFRDILPS
jgi:hypothetical protein